MKSIVHYKIILGLSAFILQWLPLNAQEVEVSFFDKTETVFENQHSSAIHGNARVMGKVVFLKNNTITAENNMPCATLIDNGKDGANLFFMGSDWIQGANGQTGGEGYITFSGTNTQKIQGIAQQRVTFPGIQMDNQQGVRIEGDKGVYIERNARFFQGKLFVSADTLTFGKNSISSCNDKNSYLDVTSAALIAKDTMNKDTDPNVRFEFPVGSEKSYSPITVVLKKATATTASDNKLLLKFSNDINDFFNEIVSEPNVKRYDKGGRSYWALKSSAKDGTPEIDSVYLNLEGNFSKSELIGPNFRSSRAYITQYIPQKDPKEETLPPSNWDKPEFSEDALRPVVLKLNTKSNTTVLRYTRAAVPTDLKLSNDANANDFSYYTLSNYDGQPLVSRFENFDIEYNPVTCVLETKWTFRDKFLGQRMTLQFAKDTINYTPGEETETELDAGGIYSDEEGVFRHRTYVTKIPQNLVNKNNLFYVRIAEKDLVGETPSQFSTKPFLLNCRPEQGDESEPIVYATSNGSGGILHVNYEALFSEEVQLSIWNITGQKEADLGKRVFYQGKNDLTFSLPPSITRGHRYVLLIEGGNLNQKIKTFSTTFMVK